MPKKYPTEFRDEVVRVVEVPRSDGQGWCGDYAAFAVS